MALIRCSYRSAVLDMEVMAHAALPDGLKRNEKLKTIYMFHGKKEDSTGIYRSVCIEDCCRQYHLAVVMPDLDFRYYEAVYEKEILDDFLWRELPQTMTSFFPLSAEKANQYILKNTDDGYEAVPMILHGDHPAALQLQPQNRSAMLKQAITMFERRGNA